MLISIQFPFSDSRKFLNNTGILDLPGWPLPIPDTEFVRYFGSIRARRRGGIEGWVGENEICEASRALSFTGDLSFVDSSLEFQLMLRCAFRRLYFDGWAVGKFEVGIGQKKRSNLDLSKDQSRKLIEHILQLPVSIRNPSGNAWHCALISAGKHLANSYKNATTIYKAANETQEWWVRYGDPLVFLHYNSGEKIRLPYWSTSVKLPEQYELELSHYCVPYKGATIRMWVLGQTPSKGFNGPRYTDYNKERALRICLMRLHAEHQCLRFILRNLQTKKIIMAPRTEASSNLQRYLNNATRRIGRLEAQSARQFDTEIVDIARESMSIFSPGDRDNLLNTLESLDIRKNVLDKVNRYTDQWKQATYENVRVVNFKQEVFELEGDIYNVSGQAGAVGREAQASGDMTFYQIKTRSGDAMDLASLASELSVLRTKLKEKAVEPEQDAAVGAVAEAEVEAKKGDSSKVLESLKKAGKWALDIATQIGTTLAEDAIKQSLGMK